MNATIPGLLTCPLCGRPHQPVALRRGERALCLDCGTTLARHSRGADAAFALTLTAVLLAIPALQYPLVTVHKYGAEHASYLWTGVRMLWQNGMPLLAVWVALCGIVVPLALIGTLTAFVMAARFGGDARPSGLWLRMGHALQHWSMPEVHVLAVLVAFAKIGVLVNVTPGPGLWFYAAMTVAILFAWRSVETRQSEP